MGIRYEFIGPTYTTGQYHQYYFVPNAYNSGECGIDQHCAQHSRPGANAGLHHPWLRRSLQRHGPGRYEWIA